MSCIKYLCLTSTGDGKFYCDIIEQRDLDGHGIGVDIQFKFSPLVCVGFYNTKVPDTAVCSVGSRTYSGRLDTYYFPNKK